MPATSARQQLSLEWNNKTWNDAILSGFMRRVVKCHTPASRPIIWVNSDRGSRTKKSSSRIKRFLFTCFDLVSDFQSCLCALSPDYEFRKEHRKYHLQSLLTTANRRRNLEHDFCTHTLMKLQTAWSTVSFFNRHRKSQGLHILFGSFSSDVFLKNLDTSKALERTSDQAMGAWSFFCLWLITEAPSQQLWSEPVMGQCVGCWGLCTVSCTFYWIDLCTLL